MKVSLVFLTGIMQSVVKLSIWLVIIALAASSLVDFVQTSLVDAGILTKPIQIEDACKLEILPEGLKNVLGCKKETKKSDKPKSDPARPKLSLGGDILKKYKFETREKTLSDKFNDAINDAFVYIQRLVLPEDYVMPCLVGDCDMDKQIQQEREEYTNMMSKKESSDSSKNPLPDIPSGKSDSTPHVPDMPSRTPDMPSRTPDMPSKKDKKV